MFYVFLDKISTWTSLWFSTNTMSKSWTEEPALPLSGHSSVLAALCGHPAFFFFFELLLFCCFHNQTIEMCFNMCYVDTTVICVRLPRLSQRFMWQQLPANVRDWSQTVEFGSLPNATEPLLAAVNGSILRATQRRCLWCWILTQSKAVFILVVLTILSIV